MAAKRKKKVEVDFSDEESVAAAMAVELDVPLDEISIKSSHLESFGTGTYWEVSVVKGENVANNYRIGVDERLGMDCGDTIAE